MNNPALILAVLALVGTVGSAALNAWSIVRKTRTERQPNATEVRAQDTASNEFLLTLVKYSKDEVTRWKEAYDATSLDNTDLKAKLRENVALARETEERMILAVDYLVNLAERRQVVAAAEITRWATIALDRSIPRDQFEDLMRGADDLDDLDNTVIPSH